MDETKFAEMMVKCLSNPEVMKAMMACMKGGEPEPAVPGKAPAAVKVSGTPAQRKAALRGQANADRVKAAGIPAGSQPEQGDRRAGEGDGGY